MHIAVSWDISAQNPRWSAINDLLLEKLKPYSWIKPVNTFYVVKVSSAQQRVDITADLTKVAASVPETVHFVVSPLMSGGRYDGYLPQNLWADLNARTD